MGNGYTGDRYLDKNVSIVSSREEFKEVMRKEMEKRKKITTDTDEPIAVAS